MTEFLHFLQHYGYAVLFVSVLIEQCGVPIPCTPVLLAMGALAGMGQFSLAISLLLASAAAFLGDWLWYELGRRRGMQVLRLLCRISLEPDACVNNTQASFSRRGAGTLLFAKFIPGMSIMATPMAGLIGMRYSLFFSFDTVGILIWVSTYLSIGFAFRSQLEMAASELARLGSWVGLVAGVLLASYLLWKFYKRKKFLRSLRMARIAPDDLMQLLSSEEGVIIIDLRNKAAQAGPRIPGALLYDSVELDLRHESIPRDKDIILYCT